MTSRRSILVAGAGAVVATLASCGGGGDGGGAAGAPPTPVPPPAEPPPPPPPPPPPANNAPAWAAGFTGASLAVGESIDLRSYVVDADADALMFSLNAASASIAGILTLSPAGVLTRVGAGDVVGVLIDADDGR